MKETKAEIIYAVMSLILLIAGLVILSVSSPPDWEILLGIFLVLASWILLGLSRDLVSERKLEAERRKREATENDEMELWQKIGKAGQFISFRFRDTDKPPSGLVFSVGEEKYIVRPTNSDYLQVEPYW